MDLSNRFSAEASALGYLYQARYALLLLLKAPMDEVLAIERFDDISFSSTTSDPVELIQTKHHVNSDRSLSDASSDLWKTIRVWCENVIDGTIELEKVRLTLITTSKTDEDSAAALLCPSDCVSPRRDTARAHQRLITITEKSTSQKNLEAYKVFKALGSEKQQLLVDSITVLDSSPSIVDTKAKIVELLRRSARREHQQLLFDRVQSWWFERVIQHLSGARADRISSRELDGVIQDLRDQFQQENLPIDYRNLQAPDEKQLKPSERIFIEQLRLVALSEPRVITAIGDYYKAYQQRSRWVREELINIDELTAYESTLVDEWKRQHDKMCESITVPHVENEQKQKGRELYNWVEEKADFRIRPMITERYVVRGSYHILSNRLKVGWHPDYKNGIQRTLPAISMEDLI